VGIELGMKYPAETYMHTGGVFQCEGSSPIIVRLFGIHEEKDGRTSPADWIYVAY